MGGYFGGQIARHSVANVTLIARGKHLKAIQKSGLIIKSGEDEQKIKVDAYEDPRKASSPDLILFTVKSYDTGDAIKQIKPAVTESTQILTLQNGIENYPKLVDAFGSERVIQGFCKIGAGISEPGVVEHKAFGNITLGEQDGGKTRRIKNVETLFKDAKVPVSISADITREVWLKFTWNCLLNMVTATGNVTVEKIFYHEESEQLCYRLFEEIRQVAEKENIELKPEDGRIIIESSKKLTGFETSTYQDRQKGKDMEYEAFTGAILRLADKHGLNVPYNETLYALLKMIDEKGGKETGDREGLGKAGSSVHT